MINILSWLFDHILSVLIAALLIVCLTLAFLYKHACNERDAALQNAALTIETNKANQETINTLEAEIVKRDELATIWQEELAKERRARDDAREEVNALLRQNESVRDWAFESVPDDVWRLLD